MKLDYLQVLELEVFTRFGARLEASMQARLQRGRLLREVLAQDQLDPLSPRDQLAWMLACNEGRLDALEGQNLQVALQALRTGVAASALTLDAPRQDWLTALADWLQAAILVEPAT